MIKPPQLDDAALRRALKILRNMEPDTTKQLKADMTGALKPYAEEAARQLPQTPPLSGFARSPGYGIIKGDVSTTPSRSRKSGNKLVTIRVKSTTNQKTKGALFAEFAGTKSGGFTASGRTMIIGLNAIKKIKRGAGRFTYDYIRSQRKQVVKEATKILDVYMKKASRYI